MFTTITPEEREGKGVTQLPDSPQITAANLKELFDSLANLAIDKFITHIDELEAETAAGNIGAVIPDGYSATANIQSLIDEIIMRLGSCESLKHSHANKDTLDAISSETKGWYDSLVAMLQGIETIANNLTDSISSIPNSHAVAAYVTNAVRNADFVKPNQLLDSVYPVGTIYTTTSATFNPSTTFGGVWSLRSTEGGVKSYERTA